MGEIWKKIEGYNGDYFVSNLGKFKSFKNNCGITEKILEPQKNTNGYLHITLYKNGNKKTKLIHILLFEAFNNYKLTNDECVHHKDKNKINNKLENLQLMNKSDHNSLHHRNKILSEEHKRKLSSLNIGKNHPMFGKNHSEESKIKMSESKKEKYVGENNPSHILIKKDVIEIIKLCNEKILTQREIAKIYNVSYSTISAIKNKRIWIHIKEDLK